MTDPTALTPAPDPGALYRVLAENAPDPIIAIDAASVILAVNPAATRLFGYAAEELLGRSLHVLVPERLRAGHDAGMGRYLATGQRRIAWQGPAPSHSSGVTRPARRRAPTSLKSSR